MLDPGAVSSVNYQQLTSMGQKRQVNVCMCGGGSGGAGVGWGAELGQPEAMKGSNPAPLRTFY